VPDEVSNRLITHLHGLASLLTMQENLEDLARKLI